MANASTSDQQRTQGNIIPETAVPVMPVSNASEDSKPYLVIPLYINASGMTKCDTQFNRYREKQT
jgi:hypothetical protein